MYLTKITVSTMLAYRGDTRPPEEIFLDGFWNRMQPEAQWMKSLADLSKDQDDPHSPVMTHKLTQQQLRLWENGSKDCNHASPDRRVYAVWLKSDPAISVTYTFPRTAPPAADILTYLWEEYTANKPNYRKGEAGEDISPSTAVCLTLLPHVAPYFPVDGCQRDGGEWIWVYAVLLHGAYETYVKQQERAQKPSLPSKVRARAQDVSAAREIAVEHVAASDIVCAVRCWRHGVYPDMNFVMSRRTCWNHSSRSRLLCQREIAAAFDPFRGFLTAVSHSVIQGRYFGKAVFENIILLEPNYAYHVWQR